MKNIKINIILFLISALITHAKSVSGEDQCYNCHKDSGDNPSAMFANDIHHKRGISCAGCHGGNNTTDDMDDAMNKADGFIGVPVGDKISEMCSQCHSNSEKMKNFNSTLPTDQFESLTASVHNKISSKGKERILQCTTCHRAHGIRSVKDPESNVYSLNIVKTCSNCHSNASYMRSYNPSLPIDQYQKYLSSVHGILNKKGDPKAANCASCHGNHNIKPSNDVQSMVYPNNIPATCSSCHSDKDYMKSYGIPTDQYEKYVTDVHGKALLEKNDPGAPACNDCHGNHAATPPGIESISNVCGTCHVLNAQLFSASPHKEVFDKNNYPECETCHGNHGIINATDQLIGVDKNAVCSKCHTDSKNVKGYNTASQMRSMIDSLNKLDGIAENLINEAEQKGMEVAESKFKLNEATHAKQEVKTIVHSFDIAKFKEVIDNKGLKVMADVITEANSAIEEYYFRRIGLGIAIFIISFLAFTLFLYIRNIEKKV